MRDTVLVTGGAQRIGAAIVRQLHGRGLDVALHCRSSRDQAEALARELDGIRAGSARVFAADLRDHGAVLALAQEVQGTVKEAGGRLAGLVNNASSFFPTPFGTATAEHWDDLFATNARAPFFLAQALAEPLRAARGAVVNVVDIHADRPLKDYPVYTMAKAALGALTRVLAVELGPDVRANGVAPGAIVWPEGGDDFFSKAEQARIVHTTPLGRTGEPDEIADAVTFLLLDARYVTGQILAVDGGRDAFL